MWINVITKCAIPETHEKNSICPCFMTPFGSCSGNQLNGVTSRIGELANGKSRPLSHTYFMTAGDPCTPSSPVHMTFTFMAKKTCQTFFFKFNNPRTVYFSALLLCMQNNRRKFCNNSEIQNGVSVCVYFQRQRRWFSARDVRVTMQITSQFQYFA